MQSQDGLLSVVQGITELTPRYARVQSLTGPQGAVAWETFITTSTIPRDTLAKIIATALPHDDPQARLQAVRFYAQAERFREARRERQKNTNEFPQMKAPDKGVGQLRQGGPKLLFKEIELRRAAGQHKLVQSLLDNFPAEEVSGETLVEVRQ